MKDDHQHEQLRDTIAKAIADSIGHGMREKCERHADAVMAILDAEGDGGAVGDAKGYLDNCVNALDHIARTARNCRVTSKRLTWIASRAESAISGNDDWRDAPVPKNGTSALLRAQARIKELEAEVPHPARSGVVSDADVDDACRAYIAADRFLLDGAVESMREPMRAAITHFAKGAEVGGDSPELFAGTADQLNSLSIRSHAEGETK